MRGLDEAIDTSLLGEAESEALDLLAEGHTAKSIAATTGASVHAINARLREARRKTGITSSRELARLYRTQKTSGEKMEVVGSHLGSPSRSSEAGPERRFGVRRIGLAIMSILTLAGVAAAILQLSTGQIVQADEPADDPLIGSMFPAINTAPRELHEQVRSETRDEAWAGRTESLLNARYLEIKGIGDDDGNALRVICGSTLCEVAGELPDAEQSPNPELTRVMRELQGQELRQSLEPAGLGLLSAAFGGGNFVSYWKRDG